MASPQTIQPSSADNTLSQAFPDNNYGSLTNTTISNGNNAIRRGLLTFDFSSVVPAGATITSATLSLYCYQVSSGRTITAYRLLRTDWSVSESTWNIYKTGSNWGIAGASDSTTDYTTTDSSSATSLSSAGWLNFTVTAQVQTALDSVSGIAHFLCLDSGSTSTATQRFYSRNETTDTTLRPKLYIEYTVPSGPANLKSYNTNLKANIKTINTNPIANVKSLNGNS